MASFSACPQLAKFFAEPTTDTPGRVLDWPCFSPGYHKGRQYTAEDIAKVVRNFNLLHGAMKVKIRADVDPAVAKLGHESDQRLMTSMGLPNVGRVFAARVSTPADKDDRGRPVPPGTLVLSIEGIPPVIAETIRRGGYNDGSIELDHAYPDPDNPGQTMDGSVLTAVAFLGEEQPYVTGLPSPKVSFSAAVRGRGSGKNSTVIVFSEGYMNRDELIQKLQGMGIDVTKPGIANAPDDTLQELVNQMGSQSFSDCMRTKFASEVPGAGNVAPGVNPPGVNAPPPSDPNMMPKPGDGDLAPKFSDAEMSKFSKMVISQFSNLNKRIDTIEKATGPTTSAFSAEFTAMVETEQKRAATAAVKQAVKDGQVIPACEQSYINQLMKLSNRRTDVFSAGAAVGLTPFEDGLNQLKKLPKNPMFAEIEDPIGPSAETSEIARRVLSMTSDGRKALAGLTK